MKEDARNAYRAFAFADAIGPYVICLYDSHAHGVQNDECGDEDFCRCCHWDRFSMWDKLANIIL